METFKITPDYRNKSYESMGIFLSSMADAKPSSEKKTFWPYYTQVEAVAGVGYGVRFGFNIGEFIDLLLGWTTIDIYGDDIGIIKSIDDIKGKNAESIVEYGGLTPLSKPTKSD